MSYQFLPDSEKCICSPVLAEVSSAASFSDIPAFVLSRLNLSDAQHCSKDSVMASCQSSPSGMTLKPLTESPGGACATLYAEDSRAKTFPSLGGGAASMQNGPDYG